MESFKKDMSYKLVGSDAFKEVEIERDNSEVHGELASDVFAEDEDLTLDKSLLLSESDEKEGDYVTEEEEEED